MLPEFYQQSPLQSSGFTRRAEVELIWLLSILHSGYLLEIPNIHYHNICIHIGTADALRLKPCRATAVPARQSLPNSCAVPNLK